MSVLKQTMRAIHGAVILSGLLTVSATAQQATRVEAVAPATPITISAPALAPAPSPLFARADDQAPTLAAAKQADDAAMVEGRHTVTMTTTVLVLAVIVLVLLID
jgi:hypothetical protein